jgi:HAE1 family hydrophobic/amphiphilic exporter-1
MKITEVAIRKPVFAWMIMASFIIFGFMSFLGLGISENPDIDFPVLSISFNWEGAAPEVIELDIIDQLESSLLAVEGIQLMSSNAQRGSGSITLDFSLDKNIDQAVQEVQAVLAQAQRRLPSDMEPPIVRKSNPEDRPILWLGISSEDMNPQELMTYVRDQVKDRFQTLEGVAEVTLGGYVDPALRVWLDDKKLKQFDLTATDIISVIGEEHAEFPAGIFETKTTESNIRVLGEASTIEDFANLSISKRAGRPNFNAIPLKHIAVIEDGLDEIRRISRINGIPSVGLGIRKQRGSNAVEVARRAKEKMAQIAPSFPAGTQIGINYDGTVFIENSIDELKFTLMMAALLTALVVWFFLGSFASSFNIILSIPTAIIATFMGLQFFGYTLNTFTMLALTLAVGLIVDDNIMILENITRKFKLGANKIQASITGTNEISFAALASSTAIIAIFLPLSFVSGIVGKYFSQFAITICVAIVFSYIDAVTLTPMRTSLMLRADKNEGQRAIDKLMQWLEDFYKRLLLSILQHKKKILALSLIFLAATYGVFAFLKREFVPPQDQARLMLMLKTKPGSSLAFTSEKAKEVEKILLQQNEIDKFFMTIGGFQGGESNGATSYITLLPQSERPINKKTNKRLSQQEFADHLRSELKQVTGAMVFIRDPSLSGFGTGGGNPIEYALAGPDWTELQTQQELIKEKMLASGLMIDVDTNYRGLVPEVHIIPDREKALARGVSIAEIGKTIQSMVAGIVAGKFAKGGRRYDIKVKIKDSQLNEIKDISQIMVRNNRGELISLVDLVKVQETTGLLSITREDRSRAIRIFSNLAPGVAQSDALAYMENIIIPTLPRGYSLIPTGSTKTYNESFESLFTVLILGLIIAYMILASQFNSFTHPLIIFSALPFSFTGAFIALKLSGQSLNMYSMIGLILLMGIVKKNSIVLVDLTNQLREQGLSVKEALLQACPIRLRPIFMTTVSTVAGTIPAAILTGPGYETRVPMAMAVIGGLLVSTLVTLIIVPTLYSLFPGSIKTKK